MLQNPETPDQNSAGGTGSSRRAQDAVEAAPMVVSGAPDPEWLALLQRGRAGGEDGASAICDAYSRGIGVGLQRRYSDQLGDRDPELANAIQAATSLPRSELLPEVSRLFAERVGIRRHRQTLDAERAQWQAEIANLRQLVAGRADGEPLTVAEVRTALRIGPQPTNTTERPEDTLQRFAGELWRLCSGLTDRGIPLRDGPIHGGGVDTALAELDRLRHAVNALASTKPAGLGSVPQDRTRDGVPEVKQAQNPDSPAAKLRSLRAHPHGSACICDDCTARDEAAQDQQAADCNGDQA